MAMTEAERQQWNVDPDIWPHTPPYHVFAALMDEDDNTWWRAGSGHGLNAYEAAVERVDELTARLEAVEALAESDLLITPAELRAALTPEATP